MTGRAFVPGAVLLAAMLAACGMADDAGVGPDTGMADGGYMPDAGSMLSLTVEGSAVPSVGSEVTVVAVLGNTNDDVSTYTWQVRDPAGQDVPTTTSGSGDRVTFTPQVPGTFTIDCTVVLTTGLTLYQSASIQVDEAGRKLTYRARLLPDPGSGLPPTDVDVEVGRVSQTGQTWQLNPGKEITLQVRDEGGQDLPAVVRLLQTGVDPLPREFHLPTGTGQVLVAGDFHALFIPQGGTIPAELLPGKTASALPGVWTVPLAQGVTVTGKITGQQGALIGAKVTVHTREYGVVVPSTIGVAGADGSYSVTTREGSAVITVVPPAGSGLPVAVVDKGSVVAGASSPGWDFAFAQTQPVSVSGTVLSSDGSEPAVGAKVVMLTTLQSTVGTLTTPSGTASATGLYRRELATDATGQLIDPVSKATVLTVPPGQYQVEVWPGAAAKLEEGYFLQMITLQKPTESLSLKLGARVTLSGRVVDQQDRGVTARVVASAETGSFTTLADKEGQFKLFLNNKASYALIIRSTQRTVSTYIDPALAIDGSTVLPEIKLPPAVVIGGKVTTKGNLAVPSCVIRIWCSSVDCPHHEVVDEMTVRPDGQFELRVPPTEDT